MSATCPRRAAWLTEHSTRPLPYSTRAKTGLSLALSGAPWAGGPLQDDVARPAAADGLRGRLHAICDASRACVYLCILVQLPSAEETYSVVHPCTGSFYRVSV
jgi:hypothetical protein